MGLTPLTHNYRLTYSPCNSILIVEMPRSIHEMLLTDFRESISSTVCNLPYDRYMIWASIEMNLPFQSPKDGYTATPNLSLLLASLSDPYACRVCILPGLRSAVDKDQERNWCIPRSGPCCGDHCSRNPRLQEPQREDKHVDSVRQWGSNAIMPRASWVSGSEVLASLSLSW